MNVIGSVPDRWWLDPDRAVRGLVEELRTFAKRTGDEVTVVFDRRPPDLRSGRSGPIRVAFARRRGRDAADDEIARRVERDADPTGLRVVTSDRGLADRARMRSASVVSSGSFRRRLDEAAGRASS
jgi:uncharacterized protein YaiI (UPF0178 family)